MQWFQLLRQGGMILAAVAMANGLLSQNEIGQFEMLVFIGFSLSFFWVDGVVKSYLIEFEGAINQRHLLFQAYTLLLGLSVVAFCLFWFGGESIFPKALGQGELAFSKLYALYLLLLLPTNLISVHLMLKKQNWLLIVTGLLFCIGPVACVLLSVGRDGSVEWMYRAFIIYAALMHILTLVMVGRDWTINTEFSIARKLLNLAWPLMLYVVAVSMAKIFDNWLVSWYFGDESIFAIFRYGAREFPLVVTLSAATTVAFIPLIQQNETTSLHELKARSLKLIHLLFPICIVLVLISPWLFELVFTKAFVESADVFNIYLMLILSQLLFPQAILLARKKNHLLLRVALIELAINVIFSILLIKYWELEGVAFATVIAYLCEKMIFFNIIRRKFGIKSGAFTPWNWYLIYSVALIASFCISKWIIH